MPMSDADLQAAVEKISQAMSSGNVQKIQEAIREWNLTYTNNVGDLYGQNFGVGQPAPPGAPTMAAGALAGQVGYIPGLSGFNANQTLAGQNQYFNQAIAGAGLTGYFAAPGQSQYSPGTWVQTQDPSGVNGTQYALVTPSGQIQRMGLTEATARGFQNNATPIGYQQFMSLASAPPTGTPQQTLAGLQGYQGLNINANTNALNTAATTGYYQAPTPTLAPGYANDGSNFYQQDQATQQAYLQRFGEPNVALQEWTNATNAAIDQSRAAQGLPPLTAAGYGGTQGPQQTMAREQQTYSQGMGVINAAAAQQANPFRQAQVIGQAGRVLQGLPTASFQAPNTVAGVGTAGGNTQGGMGYLSQLISDIQNPTANQTTAQSWLDNTPTPNKLDSVSFLRSSPTTQNLILQAQQEKYGIDPTDALAQIKATMPQAFAAPNTTGMVRRG